jgi:hypothetical protein
LDRRLELGRAGRIAWPGSRPRKTGTAPRRDQDRTTEVAQTAGFRRSIVISRPDNFEGCFAMATILPAEHVGQVSTSAARFRRSQRDPLLLLIAEAKANSTTREGRAIAKAMIAVMTGERIEERDRGAMAPSALALLSRFAQRWSQGMYGADELPEVVRLLSPRQ